MKTTKRFMPHEILDLTNLNETDLFVRASEYEQLESRLKTQDARVEILERSLETLLVAVNDKQPDPGAVSFICKAIEASRAMGAENKGE